MKKVVLTVSAIMLTASLSLNAQDPNTKKEHKEGEKKEHKAGDHKEGEKKEHKDGDHKAEKKEEKKMEKPK